MLELLKGFLTHVGILKDAYIPAPAIRMYPKPRAAEPVPLSETTLVYKSGLFADPEPVTKSLPWKGVVVHHTLSQDGALRDTDSIIRYHTSYRVDYNIVTKEVFEARQAAKQGTHFEKPWKAVGYHYLIELIDKEIQLVEGRPLWMAGAHSGFKGDSFYNDNYVGLAVIGDFDKKVPEAAVWKFTQGVVKTLMQRFGIPKDLVLGHRETFQRFNVPPQKSCPGKLWDMDKFRAGL